MIPLYHRTETTFPIGNETDSDAWASELARALKAPARWRAYHSFCSVVCAHYSTVGISDCSALDKSGFAGGGKAPIVPAMNHPAQALEDARRAGIDLDLLDTNLALSVKERWAQHDSALELALKLEQAGKDRDAKLQSIAAAAR